MCVRNVRKHARYEARVMIEKCLRISASWSQKESKLYIHTQKHIRVYIIRAVINARTCLHI